MLPRFPLGLLLVSAAACGPSTVPSFTPIPVDRQGTFRFLERVMGSTPEILIEGELSVQSDTLLVSINSGNCQPSAVPSTQSFVFRCGDLTLAFDRQNPVQRSSYSVRGTAIEMERVCRRSGRNAAGQTVCLEYGTQRNEVRRTFGGALRPIPAR